MRSFEFIVECFFIRAHVMGADVGGFKSTFFIKAKDVNSAADRLRWMILHRMSGHEVTAAQAGLFRTYFYISDVWEVAEERMSKHGGRDLGFTYFSIGRFECLSLVLNQVLLKAFRPRFIFFRT